jgi:hypothetical protein
MEGGGNAYRKWIFIYYLDNQSYQYNGAGMDYNQP